MAPSHDHLANARTFIAIAESSDSRHEAYTQAADEIIVWLTEDPGRSRQGADQILGKARGYTGELLRWRQSDRHDRGLPFGGERHKRAVERSETRKTLREAPIEEVTEIIAALPSDRRMAIDEAIMTAERQKVADDLVDAPDDRRERLDARNQRMARFEASGIASSVVGTRRTLGELIRRAERLGPEVWEEDEDSRELVLFACDRIRMATALLEAAVTGQPTDFDAGLAMLLADGDGEGVVS